MFKLKLLLAALVVACGLVFTGSAFAGTSTTVSCQGTGVTQYTANGHTSLHKWLKKHDNTFVTVLDYSMSCGMTPGFTAYVNRQDTWRKMPKGMQFWGIQKVGYPGH